MKRKVPTLKAAKIKPQVDSAAAMRGLCRVIRGLTDAQRINTDKLNAMHLKLLELFPGERL